MRALTNSRQQIWSLPQGHLVRSGCTLGAFDVLGRLEAAELGTRDLLVAQLLAYAGLVVPDNELLVRLDHHLLLSSAYQLLSDLQGTEDPFLRVVSLHGLIAVAAGLRGAIFGRPGRRVRLVGRVPDVLVVGDFVGWRAPVVRFHDVGFLVVLGVLASISISSPSG